MRLGNQTYYYPNCGRERFGSNVAYLQITHICCDNKCISEWEKKHTRSLLGKDNLKDPMGKETCTCNGVGCNSYEFQRRG